ncbi:MAG TPA: DUF5675 family protein [Chitinophagaceae bacterium]
MKVLLRRFLSNQNETLGVLLIDDKPMAWTIEDEFRTQKVYQETRIPAGTYKIGLRTEGEHHDKYGRRAVYGQDIAAMHKGMLELQDVPNFKWILIHIGNSEKDTAGCILVGTTPAPIDGKLSVVNSVIAYKRVYKVIIDAINKGEDVTITIEDRDK